MLMKLHSALRRPVYWIDAKFGPTVGDRYLSLIRPLRNLIARVAGFNFTPPSLW